ncbi:FAD-linked oxidase C-terminal domain-containing protein [Sorangium sp. So ce726]|uniref:FAD-linked oxidase C-terminal domain-containing protein n=1 Tax=Sorangium sp. So ce726 TaxID=3133319 RepID=UPI003F5ED6D3
MDRTILPLPQMPEMFRRIEAIAAATQTTIATVAHAGDGNFHPLVVFDGNDAAAEARAVAGGILNPGKVIE